MDLKIAQEARFYDYRRELVVRYFWGCSKSPTCDFTIDTLLTRYLDLSEEAKEFREFYSPYKYHSNSIKERRPDDQISDSQRHYAIDNQYDYEHKFTKTEIDNLETGLGFENQEDFFFWISAQERIVDTGVHGHFPVGSPYYFTFQNLIVGVNSYFNNILESISKDCNESIISAISDWTEYRYERISAGIARQIESERIDPELLQRKKEKATFDLFNAIRRKDYKAIEPLINKGADLKSINDEGLSCIEYAQKLGNKKIIDVLLPLQST